MVMKSEIFSLYTMKVKDNKSDSAKDNRDPAETHWMTENKGNQRPGETEAEIVGKQEVKMNTTRNFKK